MNVLSRYLLLFFLLQGPITSSSNANLFHDPKNIKLLLCLMPGYSLQDAQKNLDYITNQIETIDYSSFLIDIDISYQTIFDIFNIIVYNACAKDKRIPPNIITNKLIIDETNFVLFALQRNPKKCNPSNFYKLLLSSLQSIILNHTHLLGLSDAVNKLQEELINSIASSTTQSLNNLEALMEQSPFFDDYRESIIQQTMQRASTPTISL